MLNNQRMFKVTKNSRGFTVIELAISIFVLAIAIVGAYNAFTTLDILTSASSDRFIAAYLAQEGMEIVRNIRDTNWIEDEDWQEGLSECQLGCEADYKVFGEGDTPLTGWSVGKYFYTDGNGFYSYDTSREKTKFRRKIIIEPMQTTALEDDIMRVEVIVYWDQKSNLLFSSEEENSISVEEYLYNWY